MEVTNQANGNLTILWVRSEMQRDLIARLFEWIAGIAVKGPSSGDYLESTWDFSIKRAGDFAAVSR